MRSMFSFMVVTLDGYYEGPNQAFDWPNVDAEFFDFSVQQLHEIDTLLFGRVTYEGMASYWPTSGAAEAHPVVADLMNSIPKVVFSRTLLRADWHNTTLIDGDAAEVVAKLKQQPGSNGQHLAIFGSSALTASLLQAGLVDELRIMVNPVLLGDGLSLFRSLDRRQHVKLHDTRTFSNGNVLLRYEPVSGGAGR